MTDLVTEGQERSSCTPGSRAWTGPAWHAPRQPSFQLLKMRQTPPTSSTSRYAPLCQDQNPEQTCDSQLSKVGNIHIMQEAFGEQSDQVYAICQGYEGTSSWVARRQCVSVKGRLNDARTNEGGANDSMSSTSSAQNKEPTASPARLVSLV